MRMHTNINNYKEQMSIYEYRKRNIENENTKRSEHKKIEYNGQNVLLFSL